MRVGCAQKVKPHEKMFLQTSRRLRFHFYKKLSSNFSGASSEGVWDLAICWTCAQRAVSRWQTS